MNLALRIIKLQQKRFHLHLILDVLCRSRMLTPSTFTRAILAACQSGATKTMMWNFPSAKSRVGIAWNYLVITPFNHILTWTRDARVFRPTMTGPNIAELVFISWGLALPLHPNLSTIMYNIWLGSIYDQLAKDVVINNGCSWWKSSSFSTSWTHENSWWFHLWSFFHVR